MSFKEFVGPHLSSLPRRRPLIIQDRNPLTIVRGRLFDAVRTRALKLKTENVPSSYNPGRGYAEDDKHFPAILCATVNVSAQLESFRFFYHGIDVRVVQREGYLQLELRIKISNSLWDDIRIYALGDQYILGYFNSILPMINENIIASKYRNGHLLARTFSIFELGQVGIICRGNFLLVPWPTSFEVFKPSAVLATGIEDVYMRDFIDAFGMFFRNDYDECIRKIVTAAEGFIAERSWRPKLETCLARIRRILERRKRPARNSFRRSISDNLMLDKISGEVINSNMQEIYTLRNKIVHDGFHMSTKSAMFCSKSLGTLYYLIYLYSGSPIKSRFAYTLHMQFNLQCNVISENYDLYKLRRLRKDNRAEFQLIDSAEKMEEHIFSSMRINANDRRTL